MKTQLQDYWELLVNYLKPQWRKVALLATLIFSSIGLQLVNPQIIRYFIDTALKGGAMQNLIYAALTFLGSAMVLQVVTVAATYVGEDVGWRATNHPAIREVISPLETDAGDIAWTVDRLERLAHENRPDEMVRALKSAVYARPERVEEPRPTREHKETA